MPLIPCHECGQMKSKSAGRCPHCGARHDYGSYAWALILAIGLAALMAAIFQCGD
jgi:RNA polymerase subunit RPABC4/transcription elongation factor Spt4